MKIERLVILMFTILGALAGFISSYLELLFAITVSLIMLLVPISAMLKFFTGKKRKLFIQDSIIAFLLFWIVMWIFFYSLWYT
ncbi:MAG TPA: hypothetical protein VJ343_02155 [archaeon]|nr:hypothetical protein [archaeon]